MSVWWGLPFSTAFTQTLSRNSPKGATENRYIFYLHGKIIEDQGIPAVSERFGTYEYQNILDTLENAGFKVISEKRPRNTDPDVYANKVVAQIENLINTGVAPEKITIVGASKGAWIAIMASSKLKNEKVNFVFMGICTEDSLAYFESNKISVCGNILSIYEHSDTGVSSCEKLIDGSLCAGISKEIELNLGTGHGFLFKPSRGWITPVIQWASGNH